MSLKTSYRFFAPFYDAMIERASANRRASAAWARWPHPAHGKRRADQRRRHRAGFPVSARAPRLRGARPDRRHAGALTRRMAQSAPVLGDGRQHGAAICRPELSTAWCCTSSSRWCRSRTAVPGGGGAGAEAGRAHPDFRQISAARAAGPGAASAQPALRRSWRRGWMWYSKRCWKMCHNCSYCPMNRRWETAGFAD